MLSTNNFSTSLDYFVRPLAGEAHKKIMNNYLISKIDIQQRLHPTVTLLSVCAPKTCVTFFKIKL